MEGYSKIKQLCGGMRVTQGLQRPVTWWRSLSLAGGGRASCHQRVARLLHMICWQMNAQHEFQAYANGTTLHYRNEHRYAHCSTPNLCAYNLYIYMYIYIYICVGVCVYLLFIYLCKIIIYLLYNSVCIYVTLMQSYAYIIYKVQLPASQMCIDYTAPRVTSHHDSHDALKPCSSGIVSACSATSVGELSAAWLYCPNEAEGSKWA